MSDIRVLWQPNQLRGDWAMAPNGDLQHGHDLETSVLVSLFTHRTASPDFVPPDLVRDARGWWADAFEDLAYPIGSRLWQFYRAARTETTLNDIRDVCVEALQWLVDDGVAETVVVTTQWYGRTAIGIRIEVRQGGGPASRFSYVWNQEGGE